MEIAINPGAGPVLEPKVESAEANIKVFADDLRVQGIEVLKVQRKEDLDYGEGRYAFELKLRREDITKTIEVQMPGIPIENVRFLGRDDQNIWHYPRLYIDGSSWVWMFAVRVHFDPDADE